MIAIRNPETQTGVIGFRDKSGKFTNSRKIYRSIPSEPGIKSPEDEFADIILKEFAEVFGLDDFIKRKKRRLIVKKGVKNGKMRGLRQGNARRI